ncbi:MAG TPA: glutathione S-transferase family protein [Kofleriaceae bacterium]|nr:glutathione S-transferase family protein [Kofleriaceae bacterium]
MALRLYQFAYSPYAAKVRLVLDLKGLAYDLIEVPYMDRTEVVRLTNQVVVPVLTDDRGGSSAESRIAIHDSPRITAYLDEHYAPNLRPTAAAVVFEQWADSTFEDVAFRIASPMVEPRMAALNGGRIDAAGMYRFVKERKFGAGCIDQWARDTPALTARLRDLAAPLARTLTGQPYLLGAEPTLADAAVWGNLYMLESVAAGWVARELPELAAWYARLAERTRR